MGLTVLAVHAHPDDEVLATGGALRLLADQGVRTVLVTCTDGRYGDAPGGVKPGAPGHDPDAVAALRARELDASAAALGIARVIRLGYGDSGMMGWDHNDEPGSFWSTRVDEAADRLGAILRAEAPQVVVTYNEIGFYGHPDHIQAHRATRAALAALAAPPTLYYNALPLSAARRWREQATADPDAAASAEEGEGFDPVALAVPDEEIAVAIDARAVVGAKRAAMAAHASQMADSPWLSLDDDAFAAAMGWEWFVRAVNPRGLTGTSSDLLAGYR